MSFKDQIILLIIRNAHKETPLHRIMTLAEMIHHVILNSEDKNQVFAAIEDVRVDYEKGN